LTVRKLWLPIRPINYCRTRLRSLQSGC